MDEEPLTEQPEELYTSSNSGGGTMADDAPNAFMDNEESGKVDEESFPPIPNATGSVRKKTDGSVPEADPAQQLLNQQAKAEEKAKKQKTTDDKAKFKLPLVAPPEVIYKAAPKSTVYPKWEDSMHQTRKPRYHSRIAALMWGVPDRENITQEKKDLLATSGSQPSKSWNPNPTVTDPMRAHKWRPMTWLGKHRSGTKSDWKQREELIKQKCDHDLAVDLGYETLLGNLQYIPIPKVRDMNRSWQNFLSDDPMEWGFPYEKGTIERPRPAPPQPYLCHQMKERLWKYPRTKLIHAQDD